MKSKFGDLKSIQSGTREPIGYYRHNGPEPIVTTKRNFETASYSETTEVPPGVYPIYPGWNPSGRHNGEATLYIEFEGKVTNDYFPSSLAGVVYKQPEPKNVGEKRILTQQLDVTRAIKQTGNSPNSTPDKTGKISPDIYIDPKHWADIAEYFEHMLKKDIDYLESQLEEVKSGEKDLRSATGTLRYCSACIHDVSTTLEVVYMAQEYQKNPTFSELHKRNTQWIPKKERLQEKRSEKDIHPDIHMG
jgi:hypothetical protein